MPQIPASQGLTELTQPMNGRINARATADDFGAGVGRELQNFGAVVDQKRQELQNDRDRSKAYEAFQRLGDETRELTYGENGIYKRSGMDTDKSTAEADEFFSKAKARYDIEFENDNQKQLFEGLYNQRRASTLDGIARFEATEKQKYYKDQAKAIYGDAIDLAAENPYNPEALFEAERNAGMAIREVFKGASDDEINQEVAKGVSEVYKTAIQARLSLNDPAGARALYEQLKEDNLIEGKDRILIENALKQGTLTKQEQDRTDIIMAEHDDYEEALAEARKSPTEIRDGVVSRVKQRFAEREDIKLKSDRNTINEIEKKYEDLKETGGERWQFEALIDSLPTPAARESMRQRYIAYQGDKDIPTQWAVYDELRTQATLDPDGFKKVILNEKFQYLNPVERKELMRIQDGIINGKSADEVDWKGATRLQIMKQTLSTREANNKAKFAAYSRAFDREIKVFTAKNGREPDSEEMQNMFDNIYMDKDFVIEDYYDVPIFGKFDKDREASLAEVYSQIDIDMREEIINAFQSAGVENPSTEQIINAAIKQGFFPE